MILRKATVDFRDFLRLSLDLRWGGWRFYEINRVTSDREQGVGGELVKIGHANEQRPFRNCIVLTIRCSANLITP
ncbi:hypothetical protein D3C87_1846340 [compost metagenome]